MAHSLLTRLLGGALAPLLVLGLATLALADPAPKRGSFGVKERAQGFRDGFVLAKPKEGVNSSLDQTEQAEGLELRSRFERFGNIRVLKLAAGDTVAAAVLRLMATGRYEYVEPDYIRHAAVVPNDPQYSLQWALNNTGTGGGIAGADIHAQAAWDVLTSAPGIIVGMLDSGALTTHYDLLANLWVNPAPGTTASFATAGGNSGTISETDSLNGLNAVAHSGIPTDDAAHGTFTSGVVGAVGNNSLGVTGVAWKVQLMELKFLSSSGEGATSDELPCIEYAIQHKVNVINASFGSSSGSQAEMDAIYKAGQAGIVFVCASGNSAENIDISPDFPADYPLDNIIAVGATDNRDLPVYFSNYGSGSVEIFAPGDGIYSTSNAGPSSYGYVSGTSLSAPFVTGAVALLKAKYPSDTYRETINRILNSADKSSALAGLSQTGGRLNLATALTSAPSTPPNDSFAGRTVLVGTDPYTRSNNADSPSANEAGTPTVASTAGAHSLWWQWTAPEDAEVEIDTSGTGGGQSTGGSSYATLLGVYTGSSLGSLSLVKDSSNAGTEKIEGGAIANYSEVSFPAAAGTTYQILVQGQAAQSGSTVLSINTDPVYDSVSSPRVLSGPSVALTDANLNATLQTGEPMILGNAGGHSLWYSWTAPATGTVQVSGYSYDFDPEVAIYTGTGLTSLSLVTSAASTGNVGTTTAASQCLCTFTAAAGTTYLICVDGKTSADVGEFTLSIADSRWQVATGDAVTCSPAVGPDGTVYVGSDDNSFYAISQKGAVAWSYAGQGSFDTSSAAIGADGTVYAGCTDGHVYAFGAGGALKWTYTVPTPSAASGLDNGLSSSPALAADGTVYVHDDDGNLYALTSAGALKWTAGVSGFSYAAPTLAPDGTVYIGSDAGSLYAFNPDGTQKWVFQTPVAGEQIYTAAAIDASGNLYFGTLSGNFYSVDSTGKLLWKYSAGPGITSAPALANGAVYFGGYDGNLYALGLAAGNLLWKYKLGLQVRASAPAVDANGTVYIGCYDHNVYAVSSSGSLVRTYAADDWIRSSPVIAGTSLYFGSNDHKVYAFDLGLGAAAAAWPMYQFGSRRRGRAEVDPLALSSQPQSETVAPGGSVLLYVGASGPAALSFQWLLNGRPIAGAVNSDFVIPFASSANDGSYSVTVASGSASVTSADATVTVVAPAPPAAGTGRIVDLSARAQVGTGANLLIAGFVVQGSGSKNILLRGVGPTLGNAPFNVPGALAKPDLTLISSAGSTLATNAGWGGGPTLADAFAQVGAFALPTGSADAAILTDVAAGSYTSQLTGVNATTGVALAEIYDADVGAPTANLVNISARANVGDGANVLIAGFVIEGSQSVQLLLRGVGPTLGTSPFDVSGVLSKPSIDLYDSTSVLIASNAGWGSAPTAGTSTFAATYRQATAADMTAAGAFALGSGSADSAMVATLPAGSYTLQLSGLSSSTGVGLVEVYLLP